MKTKRLIAFVCAMAMTGTSVSFNGTSGINTSTVTKVVHADTETKSELIFKDIQNRTFNVCDGRPTAVVFGRPGCSNTKYTLSSIAASLWVKSDDYRVVFADIDNDSLKEIKEFSESLNCDDIYFCGKKNNQDINYNSIMYDLMPEKVDYDTGVKYKSVTLPLIAYYGKDGCKNVTTNLIESGEVLKILESIEKNISTDKHNQPEDAPEDYPSEEVPEEKPTEELPEENLPAAVPEEKPADFHLLDDVYKHDYEFNWFHPRNTYMYENDDHTYTMVQGKNNYVYISSFDPSEGKLVPVKSFSTNMEIWGGFFAGADYNFIVQGNKNLSFNNKKEVIRVSKYSKEWEYLDSVSMYGDNTVVPFDSGTVSMTEYDGNLYIHTSHLMYNGHQANLTYVVNQKNMEVISRNCLVSSYDKSVYTSHSFNQYVVSDGEDVFYLDHGDAYPRALVLSKNSDNITKRLIVQSIIGDTGDNKTYMKMGNMIVTDNDCLIAYSSIDHNLDEYSASKYPYNIYISCASKILDRCETIQITDYKTSQEISAPQIVRTENGAVIMWTEKSIDDYGNSVYDLCYAKTDLKGNLTGEIIKVDSEDGVVVSSCMPIYCRDGKIRWFCTTNANLYENVSYTYDGVFSLDPDTMTITEELEEYGKEGDETPAVTNPVTTTVTEAPVTTTSVQNSEVPGSSETAPAESSASAESGELTVSPVITTAVVTEVSSTETTTEIKDGIEYIPGDANGDGKVSMLDRVLLSRYIADNGYNEAGYAAKVYEPACDVNADGAITLIDAVLIARYIADNGTNPNGYNAVLLPSPMKR